MSGVSLWGVILAGGSGTRFWPVSTPSSPKQFLALATEHPLLRDAVDRLLPMIPAERLLVLTSAALADGVRAMIPELPVENVLTEPHPAGTAAALTFAARAIAARDADATMCCVHADWAVADAPRFRSALLAAADAARATESLATVGIVATRADPGFGYIMPGEVVHGSARQVARFEEKPSRERAADLIQRGALWNSGIFVWGARHFLAVVHEHTPELAGALATPLGDGHGFFGAVQSPVSVDVGVLERAPRVVVIPGDFGWDDVGTWAALRRVRPLDTAGNALHGDVTVVQSAGNVVHADGGSVVLYGVDDLVVVQTDGLTLVTTLEHAVDLKTLLGALRPSLRDRA
jgi:mannose-1-phosphate guanylyltransferase